MAPTLSPAAAPGQSAGHGAAVGNVSPARIDEAQDRGPVPPSMLVRNAQIVLGLSDAKRASLEKLVADQQNPLSPTFHRWLTPEEFAARFGASPSHAAKVAAWLSSAGMTDVRVANGRFFVTFSGTAEVIESAFHTEIHAFEVRGQMHFANVGAPSVPADLRSAISGVAGLDDFTPVSQMVRAPRSQYAAGGGNELGPADLAAIYDITPLYTQGIDGTGVTVAILGQTPIGLADYRAYRQMFGLAANDFQTVEVPGSGAGTNSTVDLEEATLDVEAAGAVARHATLVYVWGSTVEVAAEYVIDNQLAQVMSLSYAACETAGDEFYQMLALQASAEGITWVSAAGDSGAAGCDPMAAAAATSGLDVMVPASAPSITAVGGTAFADGSSSQYWSTANNAADGSALGYVPETGWSSQLEVLAGGGGVSSVFAKPGYQSDFETATTAGRMVPDVSIAAAPAPVPYLIVYDGDGLLVGGTSAATPVFAGMVALVNQYLVDQGEQATPGLGSVNPVLYLLAERAPGIFHDVTAGSNDVPCAAGSIDCTTGVLGYPALSGYDLATGLGSVDAYALASNWAMASFEPSSAALSVSAAQIQSEQTVTFTAKVTVNGSPLSGSPLSGSPVEFYYTNSKCESEATMLGSATTDSTGTATIAVNFLPAGVNTVTAAAGGSTTVAGSPVSNAVSVAVAAFPTTTALTPAGGAYRAGQSIPFTVEVSGPAGVALSGPNPQDPLFMAGTVSLYSGDGTLLSTVPLGNDGTAALTSAALAAGNNTFYAVYSGNYYGAPSQSATSSVTAAAPAADFSISGANAVTIASGSSTGVTLTITPLNGFNGTIQLSCTGLPAGDGCVVPASVTPAGTAAVTVTLVTASEPLALGGFFGLLFLPIPPGRRRRRRFVTLAALAGAVLFLTSCGTAVNNGGGSSVPAAQSYTVTVTGSSGSISHQIAIEVTVTP